MMLAATGIVGSNFMRANLINALIDLDMKAFAYNTMGLIGLSILFLLFTY